MSPNPAKAPWYFMGFQELLVHVHPIAAVLLVPAAVLVCLLLLPYVTADGEPAGTWFLSGRGRRAAGLATMLAVPTMLVTIVAHEAVAGRLPAMTGWRSFFVSGVVPLAAVFGLVVAFARGVRRRYALSINETTQAVVVLLASAFVVLTAIGVWFRGGGMALTWPWRGGW